MWKQRALIVLTVWLLAAPPVAADDTVGLVDPESGVWYLRDGAGVVTSFFYGNPGDYPLVGDWDCDGVDTPGLYRQSDGFVYLRNSNSQGTADVRFFFGNPEDIPLAGDFDHDGCDTVSIYRPGEARIHVINELGANDGGLGAAAFTYIFGNPGDKPFVGDFDGDGIDTVGLHRESTGFVYFRQSHSQGIANAEFFFGDPGDRLVAGDWGIVDHVDTPGLFRPSNTTFFFRHTNTQGNADSQFSWALPPGYPSQGHTGPFPALAPAPDAPSSPPTTSGTPGSTLCPSIPGRPNTSRRSEPPPTCMPTSEAGCGHQGRPARSASPTSPSVPGSPTSPSTSRHGRERVTQGPTRCPRTHLPKAARRLRATAT